MSTSANEDNRPSAEEFLGWYNIPDQYDDGLPILCSVEDVPPFDMDEAADVYFAADEWFPQLLPAAADAPVDPLAETEFVPRGYPGDRSLDIDHVDFARLSMAVLQRIQREFLGRYPLWRVFLIADEPTYTIVVYPDAIRFGNRPLGVDPDEALRACVEGAIAAQSAFASTTPTNSANRAAVNLRRASAWQRAVCRLRRVGQFRRGLQPTDRVRIDASFGGATGKS